METTLRYANHEFPQAGDRIRNSKGGLGTVTATSPLRGNQSGPRSLTVKWDEGIVEIEYDDASNFTLVSRKAEQNYPANSKVAKPE